MDTTRTRFAPSPTGYLHVGGARTALFNWLHTRHNQGQFLLRIEDTDQARSTQASVQAIFEGLQWLGIEWDEGPFYQSRRSEIYQTYLQKLLASGCAYHCTCTPDEIEAMRAKARAAGEKPRYDGTCRDKQLAPRSDTVIRFRTPYAGTTVIEDMVKGSIVFQNSELDDFVLCRSDGSPTYNFVVVADDIEMRITTIIRGDDHVMNTPRQILLYKALETTPPQFAHLPMVLGDDRARLSKRHGAIAVTAYREMGMLPDAFINFLARLGWSLGDQEFFTRDQLIEHFSLERVGQSAGVFDLVKLRALNADHIQAAEPKTLAPQLLPFLKAKGWPAADDDYLRGIIPGLQPRSKTLQEMADQSQFYYVDEVILEERPAKKFLKDNVSEPLEELSARLAELEDYDAKSLETVFTALLEKFEIKLGKIAQPVRVALTGTNVSPGIFEVIAALGKERVTDRLQKAVQYIKAREAAAQ